MGSAQLTKQHRHELSPTTESATVTLGPVLLDHLFEFKGDNQGENLAENAAYSIQGGTSSVACGFGRTSINLTEVPPLLLKT
jgi:hypothetical protein